MKTIPLTQGKFAIVDDEDFYPLSKNKWFAMKIGYTWYASRKITVDKHKQKHLYMHRFIMNPKKKMIIDHKNRNGLDNRKKNLRICNHSQNSFNTMNHKKGKSRYRGIILKKEREKFEVRIRKNKKTFYIGYFSNLEDAIINFNVTAQLFFGEYAVLHTQFTE